MSQASKRERCLNVFAGGDDADILRELNDIGSEAASIFRELESDSRKPADLRRFSGLKTISAFEEELEYWAIERVNQMIDELTQLLKRKQREDLKEVLFTAIEVRMLAREQFGVMHPVYFKSCEAMKSVLSEMSDRYLAQGLSREVSLLAEHIASYRYPPPPEERAAAVR